ncbi:MAG: ThiF family adenylyltransferase [Nanoarchaeota archaeon]
MNDSHAHENRYDRQELIEGWDQRRLRDAHLLIVGSGSLATLSAMTASSLGFGHIQLIGQGAVGANARNHTSDTTQADFSDGPLHYHAQPMTSKVDAAADICRRINAEVQITPVRLDLRLPGNWTAAHADVIIDATNDPATKLQAADYAMAHRIPLISASTTREQGRLALVPPDRRRAERLGDNWLHPDLAGTQQGDTTSMLMAALAVEEARKTIMPLAGERTLEDLVVYNNASSRLFTYESDARGTGAERPNGYHVMQIGAGSLGNFTGIGFAMSGIHTLTIIDDDTIEETNLNRQPMLYGDVGRHKTDSLIEKLRLINPRIQYEGIRQRVGPAFEAYIAAHKPDVIVDTVDNNPTRALLNYFSTKYSIPLVSGGTRYNSGQVVVSIPGKTACLDCKVDIDKMALESYTPQTCILAPQPSVITSNQIIGAIAVDQTRKVLNPSVFGEPSNGIVKYISAESMRLGMLPATSTCGCYKDEARMGGWMKKMKKLYEARR